MRQVRKSIFLITSLIVAACGGSKQSVSSKLPQDIQFSCSAAPLVEEVASNSAFSVSIMASNGAAPYKLNVGTDNSTFTVNKTIQAKIQNTSSESKLLSGSVQVLDANNNSVNCGYSIRVKSENGGENCSQVMSLLFNETTKTCVQSSNSCQTSQYKTQGLKDVTRQQCNAYCGTLTNSCNTIADSDALSCSIAPRNVGTYFADQNYEFEVKGIRNGNPVELTVTNFTSSIALATNLETGMNSLTLGKIRKISVAKSTIPSSAQSIQGVLLANASLKSDPSVKCNSTTDGAITPLPITIQRPPVLLCSMEILNYQLVPIIYVGDTIYVRFSGRKLGYSVPLKINQIFAGTGTGSPFLTDPNGDITYAFTWNSSAVPANASFADITISARAQASYVNPPEYCNDDNINGTIAGVRFLLFK